MASIQATIFQPQPVQAASTTSFNYKYVVYAWRSANQTTDKFYAFDSLAIPKNREMYSGGWWDMSTLLIPVDPLTAISLGLVAPEELGYPEGILAAFNLLRGHSK